MNKSNGCVRQESRCIRREGREQDGDVKRVKQEICCIGGRREQCGGVIPESR